MSHEQFKQAFARLTAICATQEALFKADPLPVLYRCQEEMARLHQTLLDVETALCDTNWVYDEAVQFNVPANLYKEDHSRLSKARNILSEYFNPRGPHG